MKCEETREAGFSFVELLIAMVVTVIIGGAVMGLLTKGQTAFTREPALADRQQNIRVAMDLMQKDISRAGEHQGPFFQVFADGENNTGTFNSPLAAPPGGAKTDALTVFYNDGTCPDHDSSGTSGANINFATALPPCYQDNTFVLVIYNSGRSKFGFGHVVHAGGEKLNFPPGLQPPGSYITSVQSMHDYCNDNPVGSNNPDCTPNDPPVRVGAVSLMRYEVGPDVDGTPGLWRSRTGGFVEGGGYVAPPDPTGSWQLVARGVEDLQVEYRNGTGAWANNPGVITCSPSCTTPTVAGYNTMVREVRVTLSARADIARMQGATTSAAGTAVRGSLTSTTSVRTSLMYLSQANPPLWQ